MPRKRLVEKLREDLKDEKGLFLVVYDFALGSGTRIPTRFYRNLKALDVVHLQKSVILCESKRDALTVARLVRHYGGEARIFSVKKEVNFQ